MLFCSVCIQLSILKHLLSSFGAQHLEGGLMIIRMLVQLFRIHHRSFWVFRACISEVAKLVDMFKEVVQEMNLYQVEIGFINKMLCKVWLDLHFNFLNKTTLCSHRTIFPSRVTLNSSCLSKVSYIFKDSEASFVDILARNRLKTSLWRWHSSR